MSNKSIVIQLNQNLHKNLKGMLEIANEYIDRYFDPKYEAQIISNSISHFEQSDELVLYNTYYEFEDCEVIELLLDSYVDEYHCKDELMERIKTHQKKNKEKLILIRLKFLVSEKVQFS